MMVLVLPAAGAASLAGPSAVCSTPLLQEKTMPTYVDPQACNACAGVNQGPLCVYICPNDLMVLRPDIQKGFNQEPEMCSECYACVKLCPQEAIHVRGYADFVPLGALVQPRRVEQGLCWTVRFRDGRELHFTAASNFNQGVSHQMTPGHMRQHMALADPVEVTYRDDKGTLVALSAVDVSP